MEDLYNQYLKISPLNNTSICPTDAQISNTSALTFDLVKMKFDFRSTTPRLGYLDKWIKLNPNEYDTDKNKLKVYEDLADDNGSPSDGYKWDRLTGESLFLLSERLSGISSLSFGPAEPIADYRPTPSYIDKSKYDVRIGIRPWDISKNQKTDSCTRHKSKDIHPIFVRPRSSYDKVDQANKQRDLGYKLASSLSGLPESNIRHDLGFKLFVEVEERKAVSSYDPIRCRAEKVFSYSQRYVTARNKTIVKTTSVTTTTPSVSSFQANLASNKNNNKLVSNNLVNNLANKANKANSKHNPSTISLSSVSNSEADSSGSSSTSTTTTTLQCTTNSDNSTTCRFKLEGRVWDRGYRCPDGNDAGYCLNSSFSKGVFLCRLNKRISSTNYPVGDWFLCDDLSGSSFTIGDDTHPVTAQLYASDPSDPEDGDRSKDKELHLRFTELPAPDSSIEYSIELRLVDEYGNYSPSPQEDALIFSTTTTTDPCAGVTCTGIQRCNSATGRCECPANHASCRNNAICCDPGSICVNNGCACDDTACGLLGKVCSADTSLSDRCVSPSSTTTSITTTSTTRGTTQTTRRTTSTTRRSTTTTTTPCTPKCDRCHECINGSCEKQEVNCSTRTDDYTDSTAPACSNGATPKSKDTCGVPCYNGECEGGTCDGGQTCAQKLGTNSCKTCSGVRHCGEPKSKKCSQISNGYHGYSSYCGVSTHENAGGCGVTCYSGGKACNKQTQTCRGNKCVPKDKCAGVTCPGVCNACVPATGRCSGGKTCNERKTSCQTCGSNGNSCSARPSNKECSSFHGFRDSIGVRSCGVTTASPAGCPSISCYTGGKKCIGNEECENGECVEPVGSCEPDYANCMLCVGNASKYQCTSSQHCLGANDNNTSGVCINCRSSADCGCGGVCVNANTKTSACLPQGSTCRNPTPHCRTVDNAEKCVECRRNSDCDNGKKCCPSGKCVTSQSNDSVPIECTWT